MKILNVALAAILFLFAQFSFADIQQAACVPDLATTPEARSWPVNAIYLHGLFPNSNQSGSAAFRKLEADNRVKLEALASKMKIRIAIPVAQGLTSKNERMWNNTSLQQIETAAVSACGGAPLANERAILGFSNGGYKANAIAALSCQDTAAYFKVISIGAPTENQNSRGCKNRMGDNVLASLPHQPEHIFDAAFTEKNLAGFKTQYIPTPAPYPSFRQNSSATGN